MEEVGWVILALLALKSITITSNGYIWQLPKLGGNGVYSDQKQRATIPHATDDAHV